MATNISPELSLGKANANATEIPPRSPPQTKIGKELVSKLTHFFSKKNGTPTEIKRANYTTKIAITPIRI